MGGVAAFVYHRDSDTGAIETITARHDTHTATARQIWAGPIPARTTGSGVLVDPANNCAAKYAPASMSG
ncbi:MAG: hypothetical protein OXM57_06110 [bacterium]|nr:hypothetical protein [bacterium]MDE0352246.1 hypothetical protein [bacterium]